MHLNPEIAKPEDLKLMHFSKVCSQKQAAPNEVADHFVSFVCFISAGANRLEMNF